MQISHVFYSSIIHSKFQTFKYHWTDIHFQILKEVHKKQLMISLHENYHFLFFIREVKNWKNRTKSKLKNKSYNLSLNK